MINWLKNIFRKKTVDTELKNSAARVELNRIRRDELSVGAYMRRGDPVKTSPRLSTTSSSAARQDDSDFATSMVVGAETGSSLAGYVVGGSMLGAMAGSSMHHDAPSNNRSSFGQESSSCEISPDSSSSDCGSCGD